MIIRRESDVNKIWFVKQVSVIIITLMVLAGCGGEHGTGDGKIHIRWGADKNPIRMEQIAIFEKNNPDIKVDLDWGSYTMERLLTQIAGGTPPDIFMVYGHGDFMELCKKGVLEDLTQFCKKYNLDLDDFWHGSEIWIEYEGKVYGLPEVISPDVLFYNKKLFKEADIPFPSEEWKWDDLLQAAKNLTQKDKTGSYRRFGLMYDNWWGILIWQNGGEIFDSGGNCVINSPEAKEAIRFYYDLIFTHHVIPSGAEMSSLGSGTAAAGTQFGSSSDLFAMGKVAMFHTERFRTIIFRKYRDLDWGIAPSPKGKNRVTFMGMHNNVIPAAGKHKEAAFKFLMSLISKESQILVSNYGEAVPSRKSIADTKEFLFNLQYPDEKDNQVYLDSLKYARPFMVPNNTPYFDAINVINREFEKMTVGLKNPEETLDKIAGDINKLPKFSNNK